MWTETVPPIRAFSSVIAAPFDPRIERGFMGHLIGLFAQEFGDSLRLSFPIDHIEIVGHKIGAASGLVT
jgi:hypothetical protein